MYISISVISQSQSNPSYLSVLLMVLVEESLPPVLDAGLDVLGGHHAGTVPGKREMEKCKYIIYKYISL